MILTSQIMFSRLKNVTVQSNRDGISFQDTSLYYVHTMHKTCSAFPDNTSSSLYLPLQEGWSLFMQLNLTEGV